MKGGINGGLVGHDGIDLSIVTYLWGNKLAVFLDTMVLGMSLKQSGTKATCIVCVTPDAMQSFDTDLLSAFWTIRSIKHADVPTHLQGTEMERLRGVYTKIQVWDEFAGEYNRTLMLDSDMIVRRNVDDIFGNKTPAAVMRGEADSCLHSDEVCSEMVMKCAARL